MALSRLWAGRAFGTSTGNLFVKLEGEDTALVGTLRLNEPGVGLILFKITGSFDGARLNFTGESQSQIPGVSFGQLRANAILDQKGNLSGEWETDIGGAGTFFLFPHDQSSAPSVEAQTPDQLYTARYSFGAIQIDRVQIVSLAENLQHEFRNGRVVVTVMTGTEQSRFLDDFKKIDLNAAQATFLKIFVQEPESGGTNRVISVEFGQQFNSVRGLSH